MLAGHAMSLDGVNRDVTTDDGGSRCFPNVMGFSMPGQADHMDEPVIVVAASPRDWANRLRHHVADRGGARIRGTVLHCEDAVAESYDVFIADDTTSFLTRRLVTRLHGQGRLVLGVYEGSVGRR